MYERIKPAVFICILVIFASILFGPRTVYPEDNSDQEEIVGDGWFISGYRESRGNYYQVDGTEDMFFVCYFNGAIDAYNNDGEYLFTYEIYSSSQNGGASIKCTDDLIYIQYKDSDVFAFRGTELVSKMTLSEFRAFGYYMEPSGSVFIAKDGVYRRDADGTPQFQCPLPEAIGKMLPVIVLTAATEKVIICVLAAVVFGVFLYFMFIEPWVRKKKKVQWK